MYAPSKRDSVLVAVIAALALSCASAGADGVTASRSAPAASPSPAPGARLTQGVRPTQYRLKLELDPSRPWFRGEVSIDLVLDRPTPELILHGEGITVEQVRVREQAESRPARARRAWGRTAAAGELRVQLSRPVGPGTATLTIKYVGRVRQRERGLIVFQQDGRSYIFSQFQPSGARRIAPCFDEPGFKAPLELQVTVPARLTVVANMPALDRSPSPNGAKETVRFQPSPPLPTYLWALAVGPFDLVPAQGPAPPLRVVVPAGEAHRATRALQIAARQLRAASGFLGQALPFPKLDLLAVPFLPAALAMEHPGLVTIETQYLYASAADASWLQADQERIIAHELAHMWFGNLVTLRWWNDTWLNEGLATWMEEKVCHAAETECLGPAWSSWAKAHVMRSDAVPGMRPVRSKVTSRDEAEGTFDEASYLKGMSLIRMLEHWLGPERLRSGLQRYLARHRWGTATTRELVQALSAASGQDLGPVLTTFLHEPGLPLLELELSCSPGERVSGRVSARIKQQPYALLSPPAPGPRRWTVPVCLRFGSGSALLKKCWLLGKRQAQLSLPAQRCPSLIVPNAEDGGYYHFQLSEAWLRALVQHRSRLSEAERVGLVANLWALVLAGRLGADDYVELLQEFKGESSRAVWDEIIASLWRIRRWLRPSVWQDFARYVSRLLLPSARRLGASPRPEEPRADRMLRANLLYALGGLGEDDWARTVAAKSATRWLEGSHQADPDLGPVAIVVQAADAGPTMVQKLLQVLASPDSQGRHTTALQALGHIEKPSSLQGLLEHSVAGQGPPRQAVSLYRTLFAQPQAQEVAYPFLFESFSRIVARFAGSDVERLVSVIEPMCDLERVRAATRLFAPLVAGRANAARALQRAIAKAERCATVAARQAPRVERYLRGARDAAAEGASGT